MLSRISLVCVLLFSSSVFAEDYYWVSTERFPDFFSACTAYEVKGVQEYTHYEWDEPNKRARCYYQLCYNTNSGRECRKNAQVIIAIRKGDGCTSPKVYDPETLSCITPNAPVCADGYQTDNGGQCVENRPTPKESGASTTCPNTTPKDGNPIYISNGLKLQIENDFSSPFNLTRIYNSNLGYWSFSYRQRLILVNENTLLLEHSDGKTFRFTKNASSQWQSDNDVFAKLTAINENNARWQVVYSDNRTEQFDDQGRLILIKTLSGLMWTLNHTDTTTTIENTFKNKLVYTVNNGLIEKAVINDDKTLQYQYDDQKRLIKVTLVDGSTRQYHYENSAFPYHLTGITNEQGVRYATWDYDTQGRGILSKHTDGAEKVAFEYHDNNSTTVTNPLGKKTTYYFSKIEGINRVTKVEGHASANCAAANREYTYYDNGLLKSKTDWKGVTTSYQYNDRGLLTRKVAASSTTNQQETLTEWHDTFRLPTRVTEANRTVHYTYDDQGRLTQQTVTTDPNYSGSTGNNSGGTSGNTNENGNNSSSNNGSSTEQNSNNGQSNEGQQTNEDIDIEYVHSFISGSAGYDESVSFTSDCKSLSETSEFRSSRMVQNASGWDCMVIDAPSPHEQKRLLADSVKDWSLEGKQGYKNWYYGYFNYESGLNKKYQASEFTLISTNFWNGEKWDLANMASPWLEIGKELVHPSGLLSTQNPEQWPIRRWKSTYSGTIEVLWSIHRFHNNKDSANGFTGKFYINGKLQDQVLVTPSGQPNISRKLRLEIKEGDFLDFAISPEGIDGSHYIGWDYSKLNIAISALSSEQTSETQMNNPDIEYLHSFIQSSATYEQNVAFTKKCNSLNQSADYKSSRMVQHRTGWSCMVIDADNSQAPKN